MKRPKEEDYVDKDGFQTTENGIDDYARDLDSYIDYRETKKTHVWLIQDINTRIIYGCFESKAKAANYISNSNSLHIKKIEVL